MYMSELQSFRENGTELTIMHKYIILNFRWVSLFDKEL